MKLQFLGGARTVTGSCFYFTMAGLKVLIECGMFQGEDSEIINRGPFQFNPAEIDYLFLTHAHIDHSGLVPRLVREGFKGEIVTTSGTADLAGFMLRDSGHIHETDAAWQTKKALRAGKGPVLPLYTAEDAAKAMPFFKRVAYGKLQHTGKGINYRFVDAGHILGSGSLELWAQDSEVEKKFVFSGDIGRKDNPIIKDPAYLTEADYVVMESTYGNRLHRGMSETIDELVDAIKVTFKRGGNVIIPSFAVGRTQDIIYVLNRLVREGRLHNINVYIDSPLAEEATKTYLAHPECFDEEAAKILSTQASGSGLRISFTHSVEESIALNKIKSKAIIIAGGGMCEGGRIRHHFKHNLWRPECSVIFVGFQAKGTLGRRIVDGAHIVHMLGDEIAVRARIYTIGGFSAHADRKELLEWLAAFKNKPGVFVVHGEAEVSLDFAKTINEQFGLTTHIPHKGETFEL